MHSEDLRQIQDDQIDLQVNPLLVRRESSTTTLASAQSAVTGKSAAARTTAGRKGQARRNEPEAVLTGSRSMGMVKQKPSVNERI